MQFGKFHGIALLALGGLLLLMQVFMIFQGLDRNASRPQPTDQSLQAESRHNYRSLGAFEYVPAAAGAALIDLHPTGDMRRAALVNGAVILMLLRFTGQRR